MRQDERVLAQEVASDAVVRRRDPVLRHDQRTSRLRGRNENSLEPLRVDLPAGLRQPAVARVPVEELADSSRNTAEAQVNAAVVIDAEEVGLRRGDLRDGTRRGPPRERPSGFGPVATASTRLVL
jgi:hypothetical protein